LMRKRDIEAFNMVCEGV